MIIYRDVERVILKAKMHPDKAKAILADVEGIPIRGSVFTKEDMTKILEATWEKYSYAPNVIVESIKPCNDYHATSKQPTERWKGR